MTDHAFNRGLAAYLDNGYSADAVKKAIPRLTKAALERLLIEYRDIFSSACRYVIDGLERRQTEIDIRNSVCDIDARVSPANATTLYAIARTAAWRDGYS